ncbi:MAG: nucleotidyltransferase family protein [Gemmatimonadota bacterium]
MREVDVITMYALIVAGGEGERLRPLTADRPKPMVPIVDKPILQYQVEWLRREGVTDIVILCGYRWEAIRDHFEAGARWGVRIHYSLEEEPLGRGGALKHGFLLVPSTEPFVIGLNGDNITNQRLKPLIRYHRAKGAAATVMMVRLRSPYGIARQARSGEIRAFEEKPLLPHWVNAGIYVLSPEFFRRLPDKGDHETTVFPDLAAEGRLYGYRSRAYWRTVDTYKDVTEAGREVRELGLA